MTRGLLLLVVSLSACSTFKDAPKYQLSDGTYRFKQTGGKYQRAQIYVQDDSTRIHLAASSKTPMVPDPSKDQIFVKPSFDIDVMTVPFKYRTATANLPRQLTTEFNGNAYFGYRLDRFRIRYKQSPFGTKKTFSHRGLTVGGFLGLGSTAVTPWTTNNQTLDEYNGLVLSRGLSCMIGINNLTVGLGIGWDSLTDRDKDIWIYQNIPWYGLTLGLNLN
ncbi:hypothetical protein [Chryseolinea lacunae]|uniref:DUF3575 domain-containing protein n=1 Tax=Chryseolinea lacunae TaxID=2801331 RepID=A0ABS1KXF1_9BACT|nr:hypothetical protein [Chryseolinea lacunae]MBL0744135.1 hypothetical protein [Chryseolinea lacunae]